LIKIEGHAFLCVLFNLETTYNLRFNSCFGGDKEADIPLEVFEEINLEKGLERRTEAHPLGYFGGPAGFDGESAEQAVQNSQKL
jgi:hypothetical protein